MLVSSAGRGARNRPLLHISSTPSPCISRASSPRSDRQSSRQRRYSSSKPSSPPSDDSTPISAPAEASADGAPTRLDGGTRKRSTARLTYQKIKAASPKGSERIPHSTLPRLPSVPNTEHLHPHGKFLFFVDIARESKNDFVPDVHTASFFSLHRPMSVTAIIPPYSSPSAFSSIFEPRTRQIPHPADVIDTLSTAVKTIEKATTQSDIHSHSSSTTSPSSSDPHPMSHEALRAALTSVSASNAEPNNSTGLDTHAPQIVHINIKELARAFRPFNPPPAPVPMPAQADSEATISRGRSDSLPSKALPISPSFFESSLTSWAAIKDSLHEKLLEPGWESFRERMRNRQLRWVEKCIERRREMWRAISVKRQRRLKIKKHKYVKTAFRMI